MHGGQGIDTIHIAADAGGSAPTWSLELTQGSVIVTHPGHVELSQGSAGTIDVGGGAANVTFENVETISWDG